MKIFFKDIVKVWVRKFVFNLDWDLVDGFGYVSDIGLERKACGELCFGGLR